jgi:hypothetical protein
VIQLQVGLTYQRARRYLWPILQIADADLLLQLW